MVNSRGFLTIATIDPILYTLILVIEFKPRSFIYPDYSSCIIYPIFYTLIIVIECKLINSNPGDGPSGAEIQLAHLSFQETGSGF